VVVRAYRSRTPLGPQQFCTSLGFVRTLAVPLHNPLGGRAVLDGRGRRHRLAPVPLEPRWLRPPAGGWSRSPAGPAGASATPGSGATAPGPTSAGPPEASACPSSP